MTAIVHQRCHGEQELGAVVPRRCSSTVLDESVQPASFTRGQALQRANDLKC